MSEQNGGMKPQGPEGAGEHGSGVPGAGAQVMGQIVITVDLKGQVGVQYAGQFLILFGAMEVARDVMLAKMKTPQSSIVVPKPILPNGRIQL